MIDADNDYIHVGYASQCGDSNLQYTLLDCDTHKSKKVYFDKKNHDIEETNTETFMCRSMSATNAHRVINDQKIANDLMLQN